MTRIGFGVMGLGTSRTAVPLPDEQRLAVLDCAYETGCTFWDTSDIYVRPSIRIPTFDPEVNTFFPFVQGDSEELIGKWCVTPELLALWTLDETLTYTDKVHQESGKAEGHLFGDQIRRHPIS